MLSENESNVPKLFPSEQLSGTATKHKDMNTLKVNSRTNHIYCFARLWWRLDVSVKTKLSMKMWNMTFEATYHTTMWGKFIYILRDSFVYSHEFASPSFNEWIFFLSFFFCWPTAKLFSVFENEKCLLHCTPPTIWGMASTHDPVLVTSYIPLDGEVPWIFFALMIKHMSHTMNGEALVSCSPSYIFPACFYSQLIMYWWFVTALRINQMHFKRSVTQLSPRKSIWKSNDSAHIWSLFNWGRGASGLEFLTRNLLWLDMSAYTMRFNSFLILLYDTWCTNWHHKRPMAT